MTVTYPDPSIAAQQAELVAALINSNRTGLIPIKFNTLSDRPSASAFGVGQCQINGTVYVSDGISWLTVSGTKLYDNNISPYLVGFWPLRDQKLAVIRDYSPKRNHVTINGSGGSRFARYAADANGWFQHVNSGAGASSGRMNVDPNDMLYDLTGPNQSFVVNFEVKIDVAPNSYNQMVITKGGPAGTGGRKTLVIGAIDNSATSHHIWINDNASANKMSSALTTGQVYDATIFRDGIAGRIYVYLNGVLDTGFNGALGYLAFAPTLSDERYMTSLFGNGFNVDNPVTAGYNGASAANSYKFRNLSLYITPPGVQIQNMSGIASILATNPTHILTHEELV